MLIRIRKHLEIHRTSCISSTSFKPYSKMHFVNLPCLGSSWTVLPSEQKEQHRVEGLTVFGGRRWLPGCESLLHLLMSPCPGAESSPLSVLSTHEYHIQRGFQFTKLWSQDIGPLWDLPPQFLRISGLNVEPDSKTSGFRVSLFIILHLEID